MYFVNSVADPELFCSGPDPTSRSFRIRQIFYLHIVQQDFSIFKIFLGNLYSIKDELVHFKIYLNKFLVSKLSDPVVEGLFQNRIRPWQNFPDLTRSVKKQSVQNFFTYFGYKEFRVPPVSGSEWK